MNQRLPSVLLSVLLAVLLYLISCSMWGDEGGLFTLFLYGCVPIFISRASLALIDPLVGLCFAFSLWLSAIGWEKKSWKYFSGALIFLLVTGALYRAAFLVEPISTFYWRGLYRASTSAWNSYGAFFVKMPMLFLALFIWALWQMRSSRPIPEGTKSILILTLAVLITPLFFHHAVPTGQLSLFYIGAVVLIGALGSVMMENIRSKKIVLFVLLGLNLIDVYKTYPNTLGYFNALAGGPAQGSYWLSNSDQDWGQSQASLAKYLKGENSKITFMAVASPAAPELYGTPYIDLNSVVASSLHNDAPLPQPEEPGGPIYFVASTKIVQAHPDEYSWLLSNRQPHKFLDGNTYIFDVTSDPQAFYWLSGFYTLLGNPYKAEWCLKKSQALHIQSLPNGSEKKT